MKSRVLVEAADNNPERQAAAPDLSSPLEPRLGDRGDLVAGLVRHFDHRQLHRPRILGEIFCFARAQPHKALDRKPIGEKHSREQDDEPGVRELDAELAPRPAEPAHMRRDEVDQQHRAEQVAARKYRDFQPGRPGGPPDKQALEITVLDLVDPEIHLRHRPDEDQHDRQRKADHGELERRNKIKNPVPHFDQGCNGLASSVSRIFRKPLK